MAITQIPGQGISFDPKECNTYCVQLANNTICGDYLTNPTFDNDPLTGWTKTVGFQLVERLFLTDGSGNLTFTQSITLPAGNYRAYYSFGASIDFDFILSITNAASAVTIFDTALGDNSTGTVDFTATGASARTVTLDFNSALASQNIGTFYFYICQSDALTPETDFCFQIPLFPTGSNLLSLTGDAVDFAEDFENTTDENPTQNLTSALCGAPYTGGQNYEATPANNNNISGTGQWFWEVEFGNISITWGLNYEDDTSKELLLEVFGNSEFPVTVGTSDSDTQSFSEADKDDTVLFLGTETWDSSVDDPVQLFISHKSECDGTDEHVQYDVEVNNFRGIPNFLETTFTATDDTFYRIKYDNVKCTISSVAFTESDGDPIMTANADATGINKIFKTGTLPADKTVTVRFEVGDLVDFPNTNYELDVIQNVELKQMCTYSTQLEETDDTLVIALTEDHDTTAEVTGSSYNPNIEYCLDLNTINPDTYQIRATSSCVSTDQYVSNQFNLCSGSCSNGYKQISWTPSANKVVGSNTLDYTNYPTTKFLWVRCDLQDLTVDDERVAYRQSDGFYNLAYAINRSVEVLQIWPVPPYVRQTLANAMQDTFFLDGVEYQKIEEEDFSPQFSARHESAMRIAVAKVGEFSVSRNA